MIPYLVMKLVKVFNILFTILAAWLIHGYNPSKNINCKCFYFLFLVWYIIWNIFLHF